MGYWGFAPYISVTGKKAKAARQLEKIKKKNPGISPVLIAGTKIADTWWGKAWNNNLEGYADYSNRIGRGRNYVRQGAVLDLKIDSGEVKAMVQGSAPRPYTVTVKIKPINKDAWKKIKDACQGKFDSLPGLLEGRFPKELGEILTARGQGLFPSPQEIDFSCSCPDWAYMCKHVAAVLYGIGARLDHDPLLFFKLRNADVQDLISAAVEDKTRSLLQKAGKRTSRVMDDIDVTGLFGIEMEDTIKYTAKSPLHQPVKPIEKKKAQASPSKSSVARKKVAGIKKTSEKRPALKPSDTKRVEMIIIKSRKGVTIDALIKKTGIERKKIHNILFRLRSLGKVARTETGAYAKQAK